MHVLTAMMAVENMKLRHLFGDPVISLRRQSFNTKQLPSLVAVWL